ncbi:D-alanyl-D-alanine carboxypeptidase family protein [Aquicoccus sp. G2-2]|uniref:D-alanyl-D-alanine carboxypeptidase family protein n=1 Tax=Aquicoccus sp. G2-2 TaxID=3092120 RepID=UPI002AE0AFFE|nr:D-alanyl-D-alanine carboxypeptidase family protein [Aquicoccus sp. G2-2]MEA1112134.1 D-alanyl-D-alanine carboxypeptidase family protein [Aquicoccus sp. G2-2]
MYELLARTLLGAIMALSLALPATAYETKARAAYVFDQTTGTVLLAKNADTPLPPASMSKLMTLYVTFEALRSGRLSMDESLPVSKHAMSYTGSTLFLRAGERVKVSQLLQGIIVLSGNDACAVIAEALSPDGTEAGFARYLTERAHQLGMTNSHFANSNGWPDPEQRMSMRDLGLLANRIITDFPEYYPYFSEKEFLFDKNESQNRYNRNPLLGLGIGADGLKTGHTEEAGYGLVGSAVQKGRRVIVVISGLPTAQSRAQEGEALLNWAFRQFAQKKVAEKGKVLAQAKVWMGDAPTVGLVAAEDVNTLVPVSITGKVKGEIIYDSPVKAPIRKGAPLAELVLKPEGLEETHIPLVAEKAVSKGGFFVRMQTVATLLLERLNDGPQSAPDAALVGGGSS